MIHERPAFLLNEHFRRNTGKSGNGWKFTTLTTTRLLLDHVLPSTISFRDRNGIEWMRLTPTAGGKTSMSIRGGYSWDGASNAPDCGLFLETLVHDAFYQFRRTYDFPFDRLQCDNAFLDLMKLARFPLALVYYRGVRMFGACRGGDNGEWSKVLTTVLAA